MDDNIKIHRMDLTGSGQGQLAGCCEHGNEHYGFIKCGEYFPFEHCKLECLLGSDLDPKMIISCHGGGCIVLYLDT
jgi:hypothetical protein